MYAGDFNLHSVEWGYKSTNSDGQALENWAFTSNVCVVFYPKQPDSFWSARLRTTFNQVQAFVNLTDPSPRWLLLDLFPSSHHRSPLFSPVIPIQSIKSVFPKANRLFFYKTLDRDADSFSDPQACNLKEVYQTTGKVVLNSVKQIIPRERRSSYIPTWDQKWQKTSCAVGDRFHRNGWSKGKQFHELLEPELQKKMCVSH